MVTTKKRWVGCCGSGLLLAAVAIGSLFGLNRGKPPPHPAVGDVAPVYQNLAVFEAWRYGCSPHLADNSAGLARLAAAMAAKGGGRAVFEPGTYKFASQWDLDGLNLLRFEGASPSQLGGAMATVLLYTGDGTESATGSAVSCRLCRAVEFAYLGFQWNNASWVGKYLMDFGPTGQHTPLDATADCAVTCCQFCPNILGLASNPLALINTGSTYGFTSTRCFFRGGTYNMMGRRNSYDFQNAVTLLANKYTLATTAALRALDHATVVGGYCEPTASGAAGFFSFDPSLPSSCVTIQGVWMGDDQAGVVGAWIGWGAGKRLRVSNCTISLNTATTGIQLQASASQGVVVDSDFPGQGGAATCVDFGATTGHTGFYWGGTYSNAARFAGATPSGSVLQDSSGLTLVDPILSGNVTTPGLSSLTVAQISVTGAPPQPNVLTSDSANFEGGRGNWVSNQHAAIPLVTTTAGALVGTHSLAIQHDNTNATDIQYVVASYGSSPGFAGLHAVSPNQVWTGLASLRCPNDGTAPRLITLDIYATTNASLANLTKVASSGTTRRDSISQWNQWTVTGTMPATLGGSGLPPAYACLVVTVSDTAGNFIALNEIHWMDCCSLSQSLSTTWQDPNAANQTLTVTPSTIQSSGDAYFLGSGTGTAYVNRGSGAGTGGTVLGGNTSAPDGTPTIAAGTGAGTSPTVTITGSNTRGRINITTGSAPAASATVATVTLNPAFAATPGGVTITPAGPNAAALSGTSAIYEDQASRAAGTVILKVGAGGLQASTTYLLNYRIDG